MAEQGRDIRQLIGAAVISGSVFGALVASGLNFYFNGQLEARRGETQYKAAVLAELAAPAVMMFNRSKVLSQRYNHAGDFAFGDVSALYDSNSRLHELFLTKAHLMPENFIEPTACLIAHYDIWIRRYNSVLQDYQRQSGGRLPSPNDTLDIDDPKTTTSGAERCGDFPADVPPMYLALLQELRADLYPDTGAEPASQ